MDKQTKYRRASERLFTKEQLAAAKANFDYGAKRFPEEHKAAADRIKALGLEQHAEIVSWYSRHKQPIDPSTVSKIAIFADSTYSGPFDKGQQFEGPTTNSGAALIFRQPIKPDGA